MMKDLIALAGDLTLERKRLSDSLRRLEGMLLYGDLAAVLFKVFGASNTEKLHLELDQLATGLDRLGALTKTFVHTLNDDRLESSEPLLKDAARAIEAAGRRFSRTVTVETKSNELKFDREAIAKFRPIFFEMLETLVEFGIETEKERIAREKKPQAYCQIDVKPLDDVHRLMILCDGNGIVPPLSATHGVRLANIGVRAAFEGKPGQWSAWFFNLPTSLGAFRCLPVFTGSRRLCIPAWSVMSIEPVGTPHGSKKVWALGESLGRFEVEAGSERSYGKYQVQIGAGTQKTVYLFDSFDKADAVFMKPLSDDFNGNGRFLGAVANETEEGTSELSLVLNPAYLVYGDSALKAQDAGDARPERREGKHAG